MPKFSNILISRTFIEESPATRMFLDEHRPFCEQRFIRLLTKTADPLREREKKQFNYRNVKGTVKYYHAYYDKSRPPSDFSSLEIEAKDFDTGYVAHSLWVDIGRGKAMHFAVDDAFDEWVKRIGDNDTGNSTWESTQASLYLSDIPHELFDELHNLSFTTYADSHRRNGVGIVVGSSIAQQLFSGQLQLGDFDLGLVKEFVLRYELHDLIPLAKPEEVLFVRRELQNDCSLHNATATGYSLDLTLAEKIREIFTKVRHSRKPAIIPFDNRRFKIALTFPGTHRSYIEQVYSSLMGRFSVDEVFYDFTFQAELAGPNLDLKLRAVYRDRSDLLVVFIAASYRESDWCGLEWRVVREHIMARTKDEQIMFVFLDELDPSDFPDGLSVLDGRVSVERHTVEEICNMIERRHQILGLS